jgi:hypothetical protein
VTSGGCDYNFFHLGLNSTFHYSFPRFGFLQSPDKSMRENLCRANLPPEAVRENPLSCKYIAEDHCALGKRLINQISGQCSGYDFTFVWQI